MAYIGQLMRRNYTSISPTSEKVSFVDDQSNSRATFVGGY